MEPQYGISFETIKNYYLQTIDDIQQIKNQIVEVIELKQNPDRIDDLGELAQRLGIIYHNIIQVPNVLLQMNALFQPFRDEKLKLEYQKSEWVLSGVDYDKNLFDERISPLFYQILEIDKLKKITVDSLNTLQTMFNSAHNQSLGFSERFETNSSSSEDLSFDFSKIEIKEEPCNLRLLPNLLKEGIESGNQELIWSTLCSGMQDPKAWLALIHQETLEDYPEALKNLLNELKALASLNPPPQFEEGIGEIAFSECPEKLPSLDVLSKYIPLSLHIEDEITSEQFEMLPQVYPYLNDLMIDYPDFKMKTSVQTLKCFKNLKSFGNKAPFLKSLEQIEDYKNQMSPLTITALNLTRFSPLFNTVPLADEDLFKLSQDFKNLKVLALRDSQKVTHIPFEHLQELYCTNCNQMTKIFSLTLKYLSLTGCRGLKEVFAPLATSAYFTFCDSLTEVTEKSLPNVKAVEFKDCFSLTKISLNTAKTLDCSNTSVKELSCDQAEVVKFYRCPIEKLVLPQARRVDGRGSSLKTFFFPKAIEVDLSRCKGIQRITKQSLPMVKILSCRHCSSLNELSLSTLEQIDRYGCQNLKHSFVHLPNVLKEITQGNKKIFHYKHNSSESDYESD